MFAKVFWLLKSKLAFFFFTAVVFAAIYVSNGSLGRRFFLFFGSLFSILLKNKWTSDCSLCNVRGNGRQKVNCNTRTWWPSRNLGLGRCRESGSCLDDRSTDVMDTNKLFSLGTFKVKPERVRMLLLLLQRSLSCAFFYLYFFPLDWKEWQSRLIKEGRIHYIIFIMLHYRFLCLTARLHQSYFYQNVFLFQ